MLGGFILHSLLYIKEYNFDSKAVAIALIFAGLINISRWQPES